MVTGPPRSIASPCVQVCAVDGESGLCLGCFRTLKEIGAWRSFDDETRKTIMHELGERRQRIKPEKLAIFGEQDASRLACEAPPAPR